MSTPADSWREIAWNGVRFAAPAAWEPTRIGARYLLFEDGGGPVMEAKWAKVSGKFSHAAQLKRLSGGRGRRRTPAVQPVDPPARWAAALGDFEVSGFSWQTGGVAGRGVVLYCPACRQAGMIQFFRLGHGGAHEDARRVLSSWRDHEDGFWKRWSLFDIAARIPEPYRLQRHRFAAGYFELAFSAAGRKLCLHRWAPARELLARSDFASFARQRIGFPGGNPVATTWAGSRAVEWVLAPAPGLGARLWGRFKARAPYKWLRLWHMAPENRILGVRAEGARPPDTGLLDEVCAAYEVVQV